MGQRACKGVQGTWWVHGRSVCGRGLAYYIPEDNIAEGRLLPCAVLQQHQVKKQIPRDCLSIAWSIPRVNFYAEPTWMET